MVMRHPCEVQAADEVIDTERLHETLDDRNAVIGIPYDETILTKRIQRDWRLILRADERMFPSATIFIAIVHHHILFSQFPSAFTRFCNHDFARKWIWHVSWMFADRSQMGTILSLGMQ